MAKIGQSFFTGTLVPEPGVYACTGFKDSGQCPVKIETTIMGPVFPPPHCAGSRWRLARKLTEEGESPPPEGASPP
jgi:hypothetical protein